MGRIHLPAMAPIEATLDATRAMRAQKTFSPNRTANPPSTKLNTLALVANHSVNCWWMLPRRSFSGMMSMECASISATTPSGAWGPARSRSAMLFLPCGIVLVADVAPVDVDGRAGDPAGLLGGEEGDGGRDSASPGNGDSGERARPAGQPFADAGARS